MTNVAGSAEAAGQSPVVQRLLARIDERVEPDRTAPVREFARAYVRRIPADVLADLTAEELFGQILAAFEFADRSGGHPIAVRAFNPSLADDGYASIGSVVETNCPDMSFLVDSVTEEIQSRGYEIRLIVHPVIGTVRDADHRITQVVNAREADTRESVMHYEVSRHLDDEELEQLSAGVRSVLEDVRAAVLDFDAMRDATRRMGTTARAGAPIYGSGTADEVSAFLEWLCADNFVFLGYREYTIAEGRLAVVPGAGLGILRDDAESQYSTPVELASLDPRLRDRLLGGDLIVVSKTNRLSTVHRRARLEDITVKLVGRDGETVAVQRLLGLLTRRALMTAASSIPVLRDKLRQIIVAEDLFEGSHDYKATVELFDSFPKDELFAATAQELRQTLVSLLDLQERRHVQLFLRRDFDDRRVAVLVALPRDRFNAPLRKKLQQLFLERFQGSTIDYHLELSDADQARIHFTIHVPGEIPDVSFSGLEQEVVALARTWDDRLQERLVARYGEERGLLLAEAYSARFPDYYKASTDISGAVLDIEQFERLEDREPFAVALRNERGKGEALTRVGLYKPDGKVRLSDFAPILEDLALTVVEEVPTRLEGAVETYLHDFGVLDGEGQLLDLSECGDRVADCISAVWRRENESDPLNQLVVTAGLDWRQVAVLRAYRTYHQRVGAAFTLGYKNLAYARNPAIARKLVEFFELRFDPSRLRDEEAEAALRNEILADLDEVKSLDEDRILRAQLGLIEATVRTNAFRPHRGYLAFKFSSRHVPDMPEPAPLHEIFVYSPEMEGIHLRGGKVARGGIRFSDRKEDYRTEILGLMKAQMVKNAVIVPVGSKGGFVLKREPVDPAERKAEVLRQYQTLIRGMLDLTDNLVDHEVVHPSDVRILDEGDPYLVVAADKGTATFSDDANAIAAEYRFWLGDAFASGGSAGYDHKELGITARGAWESVKRHFRELGLSLEAPFTVTGIGDMSGDVFGNGMLLSEQIRLVAAFDHRHVFLDPDPDPSSSHAERRRLFELAGSSWDDYDREKISPGGGVWSRAEKKIQLSPEAREALAVTAEAMTPAEVISAILRAPADLLWNGGIGTFVKASYESNADVGDKANDALRVNGIDLRATVVAEGGNLGFTQKGRIEYAQNGGRVNTDAVDNSGGVDCSDREVNLKILLGMAVAAGDLTTKQRNELLDAVEPEVAGQVLYDNYLQVQILSQEEAVSAERLDAYEDLMQRLEAEGDLDRELESLPGVEQLAERRRAGIGMSRPELCVLLAFAKRSLEEDVRRSSLPDDPYLDHDLRRYFPAQAVERFGRLIAAHPLRRDLASTIVANDVVDSLGITWASRLSVETGAEPAEVARAYWIARNVSDAVARWEEVEALDGLIDPEVQNVLMVGVDTLVEDLARWYLLNAPEGSIRDAVEASASRFHELSDVIDRCGSEAWRDTRDETAAGLVAQGVAPDLARRHAFQPELAHGPDIIAVAAESDRTIEDVANAFFLAGERLNLDWLEGLLRGLPERSRFERWAVLAVEDDLLALRRDVARRVLAEAGGGPVGAAFDDYLSARAHGLDRLHHLVSTLDAEGEATLAALTVAVRQVRGLVS